MWYLPRKLVNWGLSRFNYVAEMVLATAVYSTKTATTPKTPNLNMEKEKNTLHHQGFMGLFILVIRDK